jgi:meiotically up-regulated gene 157 (Mug157) protein
MISRRELLKAAALTSAHLVIGPALSSAQENATPLSQRPAPEARRFSSPAIELAVERVQKSLPDKALATMFANCFPNTLDTTVKLAERDGKPDTFVITGDIDAMWLRDSSAQVWAYLPFAKQDLALRRLLEGVIRRQAVCILLDSYANAFMPSPAAAPLEWSLKDKTDLKPGVGERKWEIDSLCYPIRLSYGYWKQTGDRTPFDPTWLAAMKRIVATFREQQRRNGRGPYSFQRQAFGVNDTLNLDGYGNPGRPNGLIFSMFRPSDDSCVFPFLIPSNMFAMVSLVQLAEMAKVVASDKAFAAECSGLASEVWGALDRCATVTHEKYGQIWAFEIDGFGGQNLMDDANVPSLLSLPWLGWCAKDDKTYLRTRAFVLSEDNPYFFRGKAAEGVGGPHIGLNMIWPLGIIMRALTSTDDAEIAECLRWLRDTTAGTNFMHESFHKDNPKNLTRSWFAWANSMFGELMLKVVDERPGVLRRI